MALPLPVHFTRIHAQARALCGFYCLLEYHQNHLRIDGARFLGVNLPICEALCDADPRCAGVWFYGGKCFTLDELVVCNTGLKGDSFARKQQPRNHSVPVPMAGGSVAIEEGVGILRWSCDWVRTRATCDHVAQGAQKVTCE